MSQNKLTSQLKEAVRVRAKNCCEYCHSQEKFATQSFSIEHIYPLSKGGETKLDNLALACQGCNNHKYNKTEETDPVTGKIVSLFHPRRENWQDNFSWNDDYTACQNLNKFRLHTGLTSMGLTANRSISSRVKTSREYFLII